MSTPEQAADNIRRNYEKLSAKLESEMTEMAHEFVRDLRSKQFSGRNGGLYLDRQSGRAADSWRVRSRRTPESITVDISNPVPYIETHERVTRRLRLIPAFKDFGKKMQALVTRMIGSKT